METTLIPPCSAWPDWHIRIHNIRGATELITSVEGGFAIDGRRVSNGRNLWRDRDQASQDAIPSALTFKDGQGAFEMPSSSMMISKSGASGVLDLSPMASQGTCAGEVLKVDPNTNLMAPRTLLPILKRKSCSSALIVIATGVFAVSAPSDQVPCAGILERWAKRPKLQWTSSTTFTTSPCRP